MLRKAVNFNQFSLTHWVTFCLLSWTMYVDFFVILLLVWFGFLILREESDFADGLRFLNGPNYRRLKAQSKY